VDHRPTLADRFEADRQHLRAVALRILGDPQDADDAVQEAWLRLSTTDAAAIDNLTGWLTTVVSRICLNVLRDRRRRPTAPLDEAAAVDRTSARAVGTPEDQAVLADALGGALLVVLDRLTPAERIALVLHDMFSLSFGEVGGILDRSPEACRQLASRARRRVRQAQDPAADPRRQRETVEAFLAAATSGDFAALLAILSPDAELVADPAAVAMGAPAGLAGSDEVATMFSGRARGARAALLDGLAGLVWAQGGTARVAFDFTVEAGRVTRIEMTADPEVLGEIDVEVLGRTRAR
jgi:RNA polymerase sigma factor (sigma-70 family)